MSVTLESTKLKVLGLIQENIEQIDYIDRMYEEINDKIKASEDKINGHIRRLRKQVNQLFDEEGSESEVDSLSSNSMSIGSPRNKSN